jgi:hypothetical protein
MSSNSGQVRFDFCGERAIDTGACRGIGRAVAGTLKVAGSEAERFSNGAMRHDYGVSRVVVLVDPIRPAFAVV